MEKIRVKDMAADMKLKVVCEGSGAVPVHSSEINRPGLQVAGHFQYFPSSRLQVFGRSEITFLNTLPPELQRQRLEKIFSSGVPGAVICRGQQVPEIIIDLARQYTVALFTYDKSTSLFIHAVTLYFHGILAPRETIHGVLMDIHGVGVLIQGRSSIGKSETALDLIKNGHRLVADDAVEIVKLADDRLVGRAPEVIRHMMEIRGLGIVDVRQLFGVGAVRETKTVNLVVLLEYWDNTGSQYDRLGTKRDTATFMGVVLPKVTIPVAPGRNLAAIVEVTAINQRLQDEIGYNATLEVDERMMARRAMNLFFDEE
ncbi:MAG: HPr(Ser) kinase/phosphatase [Christensenellales bacterium]